MKNTITTDQMMRDAPRFLVSKAPELWFGKEIFMYGSERKPNGGEELFVVKRFGKERRRSCVQRRGTNQWIVLSGKDDDACRRRDLAKLRLNLQTAHLRHTNIN